MSIRILVTFFMLAVAGNLWAQQYNIDRELEGPFTFKLFGVEMNKGSTLQRESILFNDPASPVSLTKNSMTFSYEDRRLRISSKTQAALAKSVTALEIRHILFDVFGRHMKNLSNLEAQDFSEGQTSLTGTWNLFDENDASELLTTVTYVARVRLVDGTQWVFNSDNLTAALGTLKLEKKIGEDVPPEATP